MRTASDFVPHSTTGNTTAVEVGAGPSIVWEALEQLEFTDLRLSNALLAVRSLPARLSRRGALRPEQAGPAPPVLQAMVGGRFVELHREPEVLLTLGVIGQFWRLSGGEDAVVESPQEFLDFGEPGFVKAAIDFELAPTAAGTTLSTNTCNRATDAATERRFGWYWRVIGPGSKLIRVEILRAVRRRAESR